MSSEQSAELPSEATAEVRAGWRDVELAWAREQLHVETDGPEGVWQSLQRCGFLPDGAQIAALEILAGTAPLECSPATADYRRLARRLALERNIEEFGAVYFQTPRVERKDYWCDLLERSREFAALRLQLEAWEAGLKMFLSVGTPPSPVKGAIAALFLARPNEKPALHRRLLDELREDSPNHAALACVLRTSDRDLVALSPEFVEELCSSVPTDSELKEFESLLARAVEPLLPREYPASDSNEGESDGASSVMSWLRTLGDTPNWQRLVIATVVFAGVFAEWSKTWEKDWYVWMHHPQTSRSSSDCVTTPNPADLGRQAQRIEKYGITPAESAVLREGGLLRRYRILGPGPEEFISESILMSLGIVVERHLRGDSVQKSDGKPADAEEIENVLSHRPSLELPRSGR